MTELLVVSGVFMIAAALFGGSPAAGFVIAAVVLDEMRKAVQRLISSRPFQSPR